MERFDFLISFISIAWGLALTTFLSRMVNAVVRRKVVTWSWIHLTWCVLWYGTMLYNWWLTFAWANKEITYTIYSFFYIKASLMVAISYVLIPSKSNNLIEYFESIRPVFLFLMATFLLSDLVDTRLVGEENWKNMPTTYFITVFLMAGSCLAGAFIKNRKLQGVIVVLNFLLGTMAIFEFA